MPAKLDATALDTYARAYAARLGDEFFARHDFINGPQLLELSATQQVNLFVVKDLYESWKTDALAFRSPYFDFDNDEVKTALQALMNVASQHIAIRREAFEPLLAGATRQALHLLLEPLDYFENYLRERPDFVFRADDLKGLLRYVRLHRGIVQGLAERLDTQPETYVTQALNWLGELASAADPTEVVDAVLARFSEKVPLDRSALYRAMPFWADAAPPTAPKATRSFFDLADDLPPVTRPARPSAPAPVAAPPEPVRPAPEPARSEPAFVANGQPNGNSGGVSVPGSLNEQFQSEQPTVNEVLAKDAPAETLAGAFQRKPVESIHQSISLNQKFTFINQLFNGDSVAYHIAIDDLEHCRGFAEAKELMNRVYGPKYHWRMNPDEADEFYEIVQRRFQG